MHGEIAHGQFGNAQHIGFVIDQKESEMYMKISRPSSTAQQVIVKLDRTTAQIAPAGG